MPDSRAPCETSRQGVGLNGGQGVPHWSLPTRLYCLVLPASSLSISVHIGSFIFRIGCELRGGMTVLERRGSGASDSKRRSSGPGSGKHNLPNVPRRLHGAHRRPGFRQRPATVDDRNQLSDVPATRSPPPAPDRPDSLPLTDSIIAGVCPTPAHPSKPVLLPRVDAPSSSRHPAHDSPSHSPRMPPEPSSKSLSQSGSDLQREIILPAHPCHAGERARFAYYRPLHLRYPSGAVA